MVIHWLWVLPFVLLLIGGLIYKAYRHRGEHHHHHGFGHKHGEATIAVDTYAYHSGIAHWNPAFKVVLSIVLLLFCVISDSVEVSLIIICFTTFVTVVLGDLSFHHYFEMLTIPLVFLIVGSVIILINFSWTPMTNVILCLPVFNFFVIITHDSLYVTVHLWARAFGALSAMYMMSLSTMSNEIFSVLRKAHVPALLIELMNMIYRNIFIMADTQNRMRNAAESRLGYVDYRTSLKSFGSTISNLFIVSLKRSGHLFDAMEARCYDGELLFLETEKPLNAKLILMALGVVAYCVLVWVMTRGV
ncbi:MAG: cobalt ECF transporter T component CbiQ [Eubacteriaceae bacterium]|nr:cobalt ECF transporter T component CbiQ [Eubacteriaceae bacterium]